jgi:hypothetical protein
MNLNIQQQIDLEIEDLINALCKNDPGFQVADDRYIEVKTPFITYPDAKNEEWENKLGLVFYPELLSYAYEEESTTTPWICVRFELENPTDKTEGYVCKWMIEKLSESGYKPFYDEDSFYGHYSKEERRGYNKYKCYVNPDYPDGYWENHTL